METATLESVLAQTATLSHDDKLYLAEQLVHQARLDEQPQRNGAANGDSQKQAASQLEPYRKREMQWISQHQAEYAGQYVALDGDRLLSHGFDPHAVADAAKAVGVEHPLLARMDAAEDEHFAGW
jgi:hypothetical protein